MKGRVLPCRFRGAAVAVQVEVWQVQPLGRPRNCARRTRVAEIVTSAFDRQTYVHRLDNSLDGQVDVHTNWEDGPEGKWERVDKKTGREIKYAKREMKEMHRHRSIR